MQLSNTSQYAIRILNYVAKNNDEKLLSAKELSNVLSIPYKFLSKIMTDLVKSDFIISVRGREGGYKLAKPAAEITIMEILSSFNACVNHEQCILGTGLCDGRSKCSLHDKWAEPKRLIRKMFEESTLENIEGADFKL